MKRRRHGRVADEEPSGLAGWLYADLFLLLFMVGLSAAWVTKTPDQPEEVEIPTETTLPDDARPRFYPTHFSREYSVSSAADIESDLDEWISDQGLSERARVAVAIVKGAPDVAGKCDKTGGVRRASEFYKSTLRIIDPKHFTEDSALEPYQGCSIQKGRYQLRLYFVDFAGLDD
jgi:hypothetical protein